VAIRPARAKYLGDLEGSPSPRKVDRIGAYGVWGFSFLLPKNILIKSVFASSSLFPILVAILSSQTRMNGFLNTSNAMVKSMRKTMYTNTLRKKIVIEVHKKRGHVTDASKMAPKWKSRF